MEPTQLPTSEVLYRAADLIEKRGWAWAGGWEWDADENAPVCIEGGILAALEMPWVEVGGSREAEAAFRACPAYAAVVDYLGDELALCGSKLWHWNDGGLGKRRTAEQVIEVLRAAAVIEAAKERAEVTA